MKKYLGKLTAVALVLTMASTSLVGGTLARYTSEGTASDTVTVAKWDIDVGSGTDALADNFTFDLFGESATIVAPGDSGNFAIEIANKSEVSATYTIAFTETNTNSVPIQYSTDNSIWKESISDLDVSATDIAVNGSNATVTLYWKWVSTTDAADTAFGEKATLDTVSVSAAVVAYQTGVASADTTT